MLLQAFYLPALLISQGGGTIYVPSGIYCVTGVNFTLSGIGVLGVGSTGPSYVSSCGADTTVFNINAGRIALRNMYIIGKGNTNEPGTFGATVPAVILGKLALILPLTVIVRLV